MGDVTVLFGESFGGKIILKRFCFREKKSFKKYFVLYWSIVDEQCVSFKYLGKGLSYI